MHTIFFLKGKQSSALASYNTYPAADDFKIYNRIEATGKKPRKLNP